MATGMSWQYYNSGGGGGGGGGGAGSTRIAGTSLEYGQEMHLKMSKKIAQLTKVIYALNTKNDEHEAAVSVLREAHAEEMQQFAAETRHRLLRYQSRLGVESELREKARSLEEALASEGSLRRQAQEQLEAYRRHVEERDAGRDAEHADRILALSTQMLDMKRDFEAKILGFTSLQKRLEEEKEAALAEARASHDRALQELEQGRDAEHSQMAAESHARAEREHAEAERLRAEGERLRGETERLASEVRRLEGEREAGEAEVRAGYEQQLQELRGAKHESRLAEWEEHEQRLRQEFQAHADELQRGWEAREVSLRGFMEKQRAELQLNQAQVATFREQGEQLHRDLGLAHEGKQDAERRLAEARQEASSSQARLADTQRELATVRDQLQDQAAQLLSRAKRIGSLEASQMADHANIRDLVEQASRLREKLSQAEGERTVLKQHETTLHSLESEKRLLSERHERELARAREAAAEERRALEERHRADTDAAALRHRQLAEEAHCAAEGATRALRQELEEKMDQLRQQLDTERAQLQEQNSVHEQLTAKLQSANQEVSRLEELVRSGEQGLGSATSHIAGLRDTAEKLQRELDAARTELHNSRATAATLQKKIDEQKQEHQTKVSTLQEDRKIKLEQVTRDLEQKWEATLRSKCERLREELEAQHAQSKRTALEQLSQVKDQELAATRDGWQRKIQDLLDQRKSLGESLQKAIANISLLKQNLELQLTQSQDSLQRLQAQYGLERERTREHLADAQRDYEERVAAIEERHRAAAQAAEAQRLRKNSELEERLGRQREEALAALRIEHGTAVATLLDRTHGELSAERERWREKKQRELEALRVELSQQHVASMERAGSAHQQQLAAIRLELEQARTAARLKEEERARLAERLRDEGQKQERLLAQLEAEVARLRGDIASISRELELKGQEVLKIRSETNQQIRVQEQESGRRLEMEMNRLNAEHLRNKQSMLGDFNQAQELLKDKISVLEIAIEEAQERYERREPRPEDLTIISELRASLSDRELLIKKLVEEKKFYQLELVNRETNFNKMFNANPTVGVINPLMKQKKGSEKLPNRFTSAPNLSQLEAAHSSLAAGNAVNQGGGSMLPTAFSNGPSRLSPIPSLPTHERAFPLARPLPPPAAMVSGDHKKSLRFRAVPPALPVCWEAEPNSPAS
ncbi:protein FAM184A isoform X2 [Petromyzon marinus]|uniref:protein FAM184A isoform X2 n=1 Tax=Petromyzon marinus TaxID=7757 RepID=UPI003F7004CB